MDVFTGLAFRGNPVAVVLDGAGLSDAQMQAFTDWTNLSEATFLLPPTHPEADYRLRIFCPGRELPFAGHPTLGSCHAWLTAGGHPKGEQVVQECGAGLIRVRREGVRLAFAAPALLRSGPLDEAEVAQIARGLGIERGDVLRHAWCDNGPGWRAVMLRSAEQVKGLRLDAGALAGLFVGVVGAFHSPRRSGVGDAPGRTGPPDEAPAFEVRAFFPNQGRLAEDPVTGSLNAALAQWLIGEGLAPPTYVASQGGALGRAGRVHIQQDPEARGTVWVGGESITCISGDVMI